MFNYSLPVLLFVIRMSNKSAFIFSVGHEEGANEARRGEGGRGRGEGRE